MKEIMAMIDGNILFLIIQAMCLGVCLLGTVVFPNSVQLNNPFSKTKKGGAVNNKKLRDNQRQRGWELGVRQQVGTWLIVFIMGTFMRKIKMIESTESDVWDFFNEVLVPTATHYGCEAHMEMHFEGPEEDRLDRPGCPELMDNYDVLSRVPVMERMLHESNDFFLQLSRTGAVLKEIRRRNPEFTWTPDDNDPPEPEVIFFDDLGNQIKDEEDDANLHANLEFCDPDPTMLPADKWDLVLSEVDNYSASFFPYKQDKRHTKDKAEDLPFALSLVVGMARKGTITTPMQMFKAMEAAKDAIAPLTVPTARNKDNKPVPHPKKKPYRSIVDELAFRRHARKMWDFFSRLYQHRDPEGHKAWMERKQARKQKNKPAY